MNGIYNISVYLPPASDWYFYPTKEFISGNATAQNIIVGDDQFGTFVKAGSIIPILNVDPTRMSLLKAFEDPIRIEVYPDATGSASGQLYLDDGLSNEYVNGAYTVVEYSFDGTLLTVSKVV